MTAVHFGAGNIGRGFIGLALHSAGHRVIFVDVDDSLISSIVATDSYRVIETGSTGIVHTVDNFTGLNSATNTDQVVLAIAEADIVTTAVGPRVLEFVAPLIARGLAARTSSTPLAVMACENAIGATDNLKSFVAASASAAEMARAQFANTAVDRIVPVQESTEGLDVTVEAFSEWVIDRTPFNGVEPVIPDAHFVDNLAPYIERKLFTVNTGHASIAYLGLRAGARHIAEALAITSVAVVVDGVLDETTRMLVARHGLDEADQRAYVAQTLERFRNPDLDDELIRVGRQPLRKLSRHERLIEPAAVLSESGVTPVALLQVIEAAMRFDVPADDESVQLQRMRATLSADEIATTVCGIDSGHPLFPALVAAIARTLG
ncbi:MAG: mannitol-1-phosphate 5-dehydrogenase [Actinobacteria bacterium]|uniref:Mannitol-1-phosphate 5-dehydrogenase n=1 Tax=freshwater metagenome TaxID=449393 RepID=A0A6J7D923_9ZZZZ|nr:mannitol-1-phosphate 5-dehydrogenase [Actinomycetota bacterium]